MSGCASIWIKKKQKIEKDGGLFHFETHTFIELSHRSPWIL